MYEYEHDYDYERTYMVCLYVSIGDISVCGAFLALARSQYVYLYSKGRSIATKLVVPPLHAARSSQKGQM